MQKGYVIYRLSSLGDVALVSGVMDYWLHKRNWHFVVMTKLQYTELFENHPAVTEIIGVTAQNLHHSAIMVYFKNIAERFAGFGFIDLHGSLRSRLLGLVWPGPVYRYPKFAVQRRFFVHTHSSALSKNLCAVNVPQRYALAVEASAPEAQLLAPKIYLCAEERLKARHRLGEVFGLMADCPKPVVLHPYTTHRRKEWPAMHWQKLIGLLDRAQIPWLLIGQSGQIQTGFLSETLADKRNLSNATSLRELCAILEQSALLVTGDSGPMHLASMVDIPLVALFGPTTREWGFYPSGEKARVLELSLPCRPCSLHGSGGDTKTCLCMQGITPEQVFDEVMRVVRK